MMDTLGLLLNELLLLILLSSSVVQCSSPQCYWPSGPADDAHAACAIGRVSMCCYTNVTSGISDQCTSQGLCESKGVTYRDSCTDPTFRSPYCSQLCLCKALIQLPASNLML